MHSVIIASTITTLITTYIYIASSKVQLSQQLHCSVSCRWGYRNKDRATHSNISHDFILLPPSSFPFNVTVVSVSFHQCGGDWRLNSIMTGVLNNLLYCIYCIVYRYLCSASHGVSQTEAVSVPGKR